MILSSTSAMFTQPESLAHLAACSSAFFTTLTDESLWEAKLSRHFGLSRKELAGKTNHRREFSRRTVCSWLNLSTHQLGVEKPGQDHKCSQDVSHSCSCPLSTSGLEIRLRVSRRVYRASATWHRSNSRAELQCSDKSLCNCSAAPWTYCNYDGRQRIYFGMSRAAFRLACMERSRRVPTWHQVSSTTHFPVRRRNWRRAEPTPPF